VSLRFAVTAKRLLLVTWTVLLLLVALTGAPAHATGTRHQIDTVPGDLIRDVSPDRILFLENYDVENDIANGLKVKDRLTGAVTSVPGGEGNTGTAFLTSHGAMFVVRRSSYPYSNLYEWRDGTLIDLGALNAWLAVEGDFAIWNADPVMYKRDLARARTTRIEPSPGGRIGNTNNDVAADGDVVYWESPDYEVFRFEQGSGQQLTNDSSLSNTYPLTDGINVVYSKHTPCGSCFDTSGSVAVYTPNGEIVLDSLRKSWPHQLLDYNAAGGWVAFTRVGSNDKLEVWSRDPAGNIAQVSPSSLSVSGFDARIVGVSDSGEVAFKVGLDLYIGKAGATPVNYGRSDVWIGHGRTGNFVFSQGGQWYEAVGPTLNLLSPSGYPRPQAGARLRVPLVPLYFPCTSGANRTHAGGLEAPSCNPPRRPSNNLTLGTPDANGAPAKSTGFARMTVDCNPPAPNPSPPCSDPGDQADVRLELSVTDVRNKSDLSDYTGELDARFSLDITDKHNGPAENEPATTSEFFFGITAQCTPTADTSVGSTCATDTHADAITPGAVPEGKRSTWNVGQIRVWDGGTDGLAATTPNSLFLRQGIFIP
jgi:hypothetical protein